MGKVKKLEIALANETGAYYAGQPIAGNVLLDLNEPLKLKAIKIQFFGECSVDFQDQNSKKKVGEKYVYFDQVDVLYGNANGQATVELPAKSFSYPFVFTPPKHCDSSYEHPHASVRYFAKVVLQLPFLSRNHTVKKPFTIVALVDLAKEPSTMTPLTRQGRITPTGGLFSLSSGAIECQVHLDRGAYVAGEKIMINADIANGSRKEVKKVHCWLQQNVILKCKGGKLFIRGEKIGLLKQGGIKPKSTQVWEAESLQIPPLPPTNLGNCKLIDVMYYLTFLVSVDKKNEIVMSLPLTLGTIPLYKQPSQAPSPPAYAATGTDSKEEGTSVMYPHLSGGGSSSQVVPQYSAQPSAPVLDDYLGPPPSYNECSSMPTAPVTTTEENASEDVHGNAGTYRPLYPTYID